MPVCRLTLFSIGPEQTYLTDVTYCPDMILLDHNPPDPVTLLAQQLRDAGLLAHTPVPAPAPVAEYQPMHCNAFAQWLDGWLVRLLPRHERSLLDRQQD